MGERVDVGSGVGLEVAALGDAATLLAGALGVTVIPPHPARMSATITKRAGRVTYRLKPRRRKAAICPRVTAPLGQNRFVSHPPVMPAAASELMARSCWLALSSVK